MPSYYRYSSNELKKPHLLAIVNKYKDKHNIKGTSKMNKQELIDVINKYKIPLPQINY